MPAHPPRSTLFPYTTLFRSCDGKRCSIFLDCWNCGSLVEKKKFSSTTGLRSTNTATRTKDRKSTRLNSSHVAISYAVFCLKKKTCGRQPLLSAALGSAACYV